MARAAFGILLPIQRGANGYFNQGFDALTQIRSNLRNLILTDKGERIFQPDFGCEIRRYLFENMTDATVIDIRASIISAVNLWMPFLRITNVKLNALPDNNRIELDVSFTLTNNPTITDAIKVIF